MSTMLSGPISRALCPSAPSRISRAMALTPTHGLFPARCLFMASMLTLHEQRGTAAAQMAPDRQASAGRAGSAGGLSGRRSFGPNAGQSASAFRSGLHPYMMVRLSNPSWLFDNCLLRLVSRGGIKRQNWSRLLSSERCITLTYGPGL
jgi:hypothetical protein